MEKKQEKVLIGGEEVLVDFTHDESKKNIPHPNGPRSLRRKTLKKRCKRLREVRNKLMCGGEVICDDMKKHRKKVTEMLRAGIINPYQIMKATGTR